MPSNNMALAVPELPLQDGNQGPLSLGCSGTENGVRSLSVNPAPFKCAAIFSARSVQLPADKVVFVSTNSLYNARNST